MSDPNFKSEGSSAKAKEVAAQVALKPPRKKAPPKLAVIDQNGDYLVTVKGNQPDIQKTLTSLFKKQTFSPST